MNVFYLSHDPKTCAREHIDKHVVKMCCEYAQLMSTAHRVVDGKVWLGVNSRGHKLKRWFLEDGELNSRLYKASHVNHPSNIWVRSSQQNYEWLFKLWKHLCKEYTYRYDKVHKSQRDLESILIVPPMLISDEGFTEPPPAMKAYPKCIVEGDSIASYRNFYWEDKRKFSAWTRRRKPEWWNERERIEAKTPVCVTE